LNADNLSLQLQKQVVRPHPCAAFFLGFGFESV